MTYINMHKRHIVCLVVGFELSQYCRNSFKNCMFIVLVQNEKDYFCFALHSRQSYEIKFDKI